MGILFAIIALVSWGLGDFLIQKSTRRTKRWPMGLLNTLNYETPLKQKIS